MKTQHIICDLVWIKSNFEERRLSTNRCCWLHRVENHPELCPLSMPSYGKPQTLSNTLKHVAKHLGHFSEINQKQ